MSTVMEKEIPKEEKKLNEERRINQDTDLKSILEQVLLDKNPHPLVHKALGQERALRKRTQEELDELLGRLKKSVAGSERDTKTIREKTLTKLETDLELVKVLNGALASYTPSVHDQMGKKTVRFPLKFNKMDLAISAASTFLTTENFERLCEGEAPRGYSYTTKPLDITVMGENPVTLYGSPKGTVFKTAALTMYASYTDKVKLYELNLKPEGPYSNWIDNSSIVHRASLPIGLELEKLDDRFKNFTYSFDNSFVYTHSGYTFGDGLRGEETLYPKGKAFAAKDCGSSIEEICHVLPPMTTFDQLCYYRTKTGVGADNPTWRQSPMAESMDSLFDVVNVKDPQTDIRAGQVLSTRSFNLNTDPKMEDSDGVGGHTGLVLGFISQGPDSQGYSVV